MTVAQHHQGVDVNARIAGLLRDLADIQSTKPKAFGYGRAARAVFDLEISLATLVAQGTAATSIAGVGPSSARVIAEVLESGGSRAVESAIDASGRRVEVERRRDSRRHVLSRAEVRRVLADETLDGPRPSAYRADFQMHSVWSDGRPTLTEIADACLARGYTHAAITDHSHGLAVAGGMSMAEATRQRSVVDRLNAALAGGFRLLHGVEANIDADGALDLGSDDVSSFDIVLVAPHSVLRRTHDQTARLTRAVRGGGVHVLAHPRGRMAGARSGLVADWESVFEACAEANVAIEIDGDPSRQDLDFELARRALDAGCLFALDGDAHTVAQLDYAQTAVAHARLAGIPESRILNYWPLDRLLAWLADRPR